MSWEKVYIEFENETVDFLDSGLTKYSIDELNVFCKNWNLSWEKINEKEILLKEKINENNKCRI